MGMMLKKVNRPRDLKWYQAGAMLYGDWGTSKAYVLGIAFALSGHASWFFLGLMSALTAVVGFCYMIICRLFPDGGGVYSAVRGRSKTLAMIGALLLLADYVVTASLSALDAFHYFSFPHPEIWAVVSIVIIGGINWLGVSKVGSLAAIIAVLASIAALILFAFTLPHLGHIQLTMPEPNLPKNWSVFVGIVLALSGVEAVANMTGVMVEPVEKTAKKSIWPVLIEVSVLTFLLGIAMNAIPGLTGHTEDMLRVLADYYVAPWYGQVISVVFGFLLLAAVNTAVGGLVNIQYSLAKDHEIPSFFAAVNRFGMPWIALIVAVCIPVAVLLFESDLVGLASLYAVGVVGAISLNLLSCGTNLKLAVQKWEKWLLLISGVVLLLVEMTICAQKIKAFIFVSIVLTAGLSLRALSKMVVRVPVAIPMGEAGINVLTVQEAVGIAPLYSSSTFVALKHLNSVLLNEAIMRAKAMGENAIYLGVVEDAPSEVYLEEAEPSRESVELLSQAQKEIENNGLTGLPVWQLGDNPGKLIAMAAKTLNVGSVFIGTTKKSALINLLRGDLFRALARNIPHECRLFIVG